MQPVVKHRVPFCGMLYHTSLQERHCCVKTTYINDTIWKPTVNVKQRGATASLYALQYADDGYAYLSVYAAMHYTCHMHTINQDTVHKQNTSLLSFV